VEAKTVDAKYVYLDVVGYSRGRTVEAQTDITSSLNQIVKQAVGSLSVSPEDIIYIPTGDGICIGLLNISEPYDVHVELGLAILKMVHDQGNAQADPMRKFVVRVAVNENVDNLIVDVNDRRNVAGAGINLAQRILALGDGGSLLAGQGVYDRLAQREKYHKRFREHSAIVKHQVSIKVYQVVDTSVTYLNSDVPIFFRPRPEPKLTMLVAYLIGHLKHKDFILRHAPMAGSVQYSLFALMATLARDAVGFSEQTATTKFYSHLPRLGADATLDDYFRYYDRIDFWILADHMSTFSELHLKPYSGCFEWSTIFVTAEGLEKLKRDWPSIPKELELA